MQLFAIYAICLADSAKSIISSGSIEIKDKTTEILLKKEGKHILYNVYCTYNKL